MATESCEETYPMSDEQLLDKAPISASLPHNSEIISTTEAMETEECKSHDYFVGVQQFLRPLLLQRFVQFNCLKRANAYFLL